MIVNETPIRTSRNYEINNINLKEFDLPNNIGKFDELHILKGKISEEKVNLKKLKYGLSKKIYKQIQENSNKNIKIEIKKEEMVEVNFDFNKENSSLVCNIEIEAFEGSNGVVILKYESKDDDTHFNNSQINIRCENSANLRIVFVNLLNTNSNNFVAIENVLEDEANLDFTIIDFGGKNSVSNYYSNIKGLKAKSNLDAIYLGKDNQILDLNYIAELFGEKTEANINVQGAIKDNCKKHFKGTIDFKKGSKKAKGDENEYCMILSETAKSIALPMLLCTEEDVEGNHSTATGKVGPKELFYIMSRGFSEKEALKLMVRAKFNKVLDKIEDKELKEKILKEIDKKLE